MKIEEDDLQNLPETLSLEQVRRICRISKLTARFYVKSGLLKNKNSGKQTRCYSIAKKDFISFLQSYDEDSSRFLAPENWYKNGGQQKANRRKKPIPPDCEDRFKKNYYERCLRYFPDLLTVPQIVEFTGYSDSTVGRWCKRGYIKTIMTKPKVLVPKAYFMELLLSDYYENISQKSATHIEHLTRIYSEYEESKRNES